MKLATESERTRWLAFVGAQPLPLEVDAKPSKKSRSNEQNHLLFGVIYPPIAEAMGYDLGDVHEWFCGRMWGWRDIKVPKTPRNPEGLASVPLRSTTRDENGKRNVIDAQTFARFIDMVDRVAAQVGIYIPMETAA